MLDDLPYFYGDGVAKWAEGEAIVHDFNLTPTPGKLAPGVKDLTINMAINRPTTISCEISMEAYHQMIYGADPGAFFTISAQFPRKTAPDPLFHRPRDMGWREAIAWIRRVWKHRHLVTTFGFTLPNVRFVSEEHRSDSRHATLTFQQEGPAR